MTTSECFLVDLGPSRGGSWTLKGTGAILSTRGGGEAGILVLSLEDERVERGASRADVGGVAWGGGAEKKRRRVTAERGRRALVAVLVRRYVVGKMD